MEYIKLLLADDEPIILRGLKKLISWEQLGIRIVAEANDGIELRDLIARHNPQLIISDISMPGGSGIDVITELNEQGYSGKVIFISAFQEFGYARQAIQLGALDYLVKPINKIQLERVVGKAVSMIRETSDGERNKKMLNYYEGKNRVNTIEQLLDGLLDGDTNTLADLTQLGVIVVSRWITVCVLEMDDYAATSRWEERERYLVNFAVSNIIRETLDQESMKGKGLLIQKEGLFTILVQHEEKDYPLQLVQDLRHKIQQYLKLSVSCGVGTSMAGMEKAEETYREALKALHSKFFMGTNQVIRYGETLTEANNENRPITVLQSNLVKALTTMEREKIEPLIKELLEQIRIQAGNNKNLALTGVYNAVLTLIQELEKFGGELERYQGGLLERWNDCLSYADVAQEVVAILTEMQQKLASKAPGKERALLTKVKSHIEENYDSNITLESMAALVYMNSYYFSSFFKKHTGQNFKNYVTEVRMSHALKLLMETELMVYEIADRVGYNNVRHFSDMFKKKYGKVPQDYRQSFRQFET
ncbi:response regulator [Paenibacillus sp. 7516]|uniref:response regulator n=1 Tax=Paenibacillus sp. 7516 TaxID=2022549 RepID=UPI000BA7531E|nr:response regulator [Paenibacillus sp. 7516]PAF32595.1 two-component system response regulator [Paenibacillus sp. 7516]